MCQSEDVEVRGQESVVRRQRVRGRAGRETRGGKDSEGEPKTRRIHREAVERARARAGENAGRESRALRPRKRAERPRAHRREACFRCQISLESRPACLHLER